MAQNDARIRWMQRVCCGGLSIPPELFDEMFTGKPGNSIPCQESRAEGAKALENVTKFLDAEIPDPILVIYLIGASRTSNAHFESKPAPEVVEAAPEPVEEAVAAPAPEEPVAEAAAEEEPGAEEEAATEEEEPKAEEEPAAAEPKEEPAAAAPVAVQNLEGLSLHVVVGTVMPDTITDVPAYYFVRQDSNRIEEDQMQNSLVIGSLAAPSLQVMKLVLERVYRSILSSTNLGQRKVGEKSTALHGRDGVTNEFLSNLAKFTSQVCHSAD